MAPGIRKNSGEHFARENSIEEVWALECPEFSQSRLHSQEFFTSIETTYVIAPCIRKTRESTSRQLCSDHNMPASWEVSRDYCIVATCSKVSNNIETTYGTARGDH